MLSGDFIVGYQERNLGATGAPPFMCVNCANNRGRDFVQTYLYPIRIEDGESLERLDSIARERQRKFGLDSSDIRCDLCWSLIFEHGG